MNTDLVTRLKKSYLYDILKPDIDKFERAAIIKSLVVDEGLTQNQFGLKYGIPKATLSNWLLFTEDRKEEYEQRLKEGHDITSIYKAMRHGKRKIMVENACDTWVKEAVIHVRYMRTSKCTTTDETKQHLEKLNNEINQWIVDIDLKEKRNNQ